MFGCATAGVVAGGAAYLATGNAGVAAGTALGATELCLEGNQNGYENETSSGGEQP